MTNRTRKSRKKADPKLEAEAQALIQQAVTQAEGLDGVIGHAPIDTALYNAGEPLPTDDELASLDADERASEGPMSPEEALMALEEPVHTTSATEGEPIEVKAFDAILSELSEDKINETVMQIASVMDDRAAFEKGKKGDDANIQRTLKKARAAMIQKRAAAVMLACNVDPGILNRSIHEGSRYNVYAIGKLADVITGLTGGTMQNAINRAVTRSLFQFRAAGKQFTGEMAKAAASDKIRIDPSLRKFMVSHTVSASTAPTQASSTMQALESLGIVKRSGSVRSPVFELTDTPATKKLEDMLQAA